MDQLKHGETSINQGEKIKMRIPNNLAMLLLGLYLVIQGVVHLMGGG
jgi:hypothetical protein